MSVQIPSTILSTLENFNGKVAYSYGPDTTGVPLVSGTYFSGYWGCVLNQPQVLLKKLYPENDYMIPTSTGTSLFLFSQNQLATSSPNRFTNLAFAFNNSGAIIVALQDNGESDSYPVPTPLIRLYRQSGNSILETGWIGRAPAIYNTVQTNFPERIPSPRFPTWRTGEVSIFYQVDDKIYQRLLHENFTGEYLVLTNLTGSYQTRTSVDVFENSFKAPYHPYRYSLFNSSEDKRTLRALVTKSFTDFAFEDFDRYASDSISNVQSISGYQLTGGWGNWHREFLLGSPAAQAVSFDIWLMDNYSQYASGAISGELNIVSGRYYVQAPNPKLDLEFDLLYDTFDTYNPGTLEPIDANNMTGVIYAGVTLVSARVLPSGYFS